MSSDSHPAPKYGRIFLALFALTVSEILYANLHLPKVAIVLGLVFLAMIKASLVAMFYMHLKFEKILLTVIALAPLVFSLVLVLMVGFDIRHVIP